MGSTLAGKHSSIKLCTLYSLSDGIKVSVKVTKTLHKTQIQDSCYNNSNAGSLHNNEQQGGGGGETRRLVTLQTLTNNYVPRTCAELVHTVKDTGEPWGGGGGGGEGERGEKDGSK